MVFHAELCHIDTQDVCHTFDKKHEQTGKRLLADRKSSSLPSVCITYSFTENHLVFVL